MWKHVEALWVSHVSITREYREWLFHGHIIVTWCTNWDKKKQTSTRWQCKMCKCKAARLQSSFILFKVKNRYNMLQLATGCFYPWNFPGEPLGNLTQGWDPPQSFGQGWGDFGNLGDLHYGLPRDGNFKRLYRCFQLCFHYSPVVLCFPMSRSSCKRPRPILPRCCVLFKTLFKTLFKILTSLFS